HLLVEQAISGKIIPHFLQRYHQRLHRVMVVAAIGWVLLGVGRRQPRKRVGDPYVAIDYTVDLQDPAHVDAGPPSPYASLQKITRHALAQDRLSQFSKIAHARLADHGEGELRPISA